MMVMGDDGDGEMVIVMVMMMVAGDGQGAHPPPATHLLGLRGGDSGGEVLLLPQVSHLSRIS